MDRWLAAIGQCATWDAALAREVAAAAQLVKGYGDVRRKLTALFDQLLDTTMSLAGFESRRGEGFPLATNFAGSYRALVLKGPDGEAQAQRLATDVRAQVEVAKTSLTA
jgi:hypothetical protein